MKYPSTIKIALSPKLLQRASEHALKRSQIFRHLFKKFKSVGQSHPLVRHLSSQSRKSLGQYSRFARPKRIPPEIRKLYEKHGLPYNY